MIDVAIRTPGRLAASSPNKVGNNSGVEHQKIGRPVSCWRYSFSAEAEYRMGTDQEKAAETRIALLANPAKTVLAAR